VNSKEEEAVLKAIAEGHTKFYLIDAILRGKGLSPTFRHTDAILRRLRKAGKIEHAGQKIGWRLKR